MPELPEVETLVRDLNSEGLVGRNICNSNVLWQRSIAVPSPAEFSARIKGQQVKAVRRRAKFIVLDFKSGYSLLIHLRMTGRFKFFDPAQAFSPYDRVILTLDDGRQLRFTDIRKFGKWYLLENAGIKLNALGPEPLDDDFKESVFVQLMKTRNRRLKALLLDQTFVAGLGNIYVDEALWQARLHPETLSGRLRKQEVSDLYHAIRAVLQSGIKNLGTTIGKTDVNFYSVSGRRGRNQDSLMVFRRTGEPCERCGTKIKRIIVTQRSSHFCPKCQKKRRAP